MALSHADQRKRRTWPRRHMHDRLRPPRHGTRAVAASMRRMAGESIRHPISRLLDPPTPPSTRASVRVKRTRCYRLVVSRSPTGPASSDLSVSVDGDDASRVSAFVEYYLRSSRGCGCRFRGRRAASTSARGEVMPRSAPSPRTSVSGAVLLLRAPVAHVWLGLFDLFMGMPNGWVATLTRLSRSRLVYPAYLSLYK